MSSQQHLRHGSIIPAVQSRWTLSGLIAALDHLLSETQANEWDSCVG